MGPNLLPGLAGSLFSVLLVAEATLTRLFFWAFPHGPARSAALVPFAPSSVQPASLQGRGRAPFNEVTDILSPLTLFPSLQTGDGGVGGGVYLARPAAIRRQEMSNLLYGANFSELRAGPGVARSALRRIQQKCGRRVCFFYDSS